MIDQNTALLSVRDLSSGAALSAALHMVTHERRCLTCCPLQISGGGTSCTLFDRRRVQHMCLIAVTLVIPEYVLW